MSEKRASLSELRKRASAASDALRLRRVLRELRDDPRSGARELALVVDRRLRRQRAESRRLTRLFAHRRTLFERGLRLVAGVDEVGMGPLAGPVVAAAVVLPAEVHLPGLDDSKKLTPALREELDAAIREQAFAVAIGQAEVAEIDRINILQAGLQAMRRAVAGLAVAPEHLLVDARTIPDVSVAQTALARGDSRDGSIAAASIVAKVHRDALMRRLDGLHPGYGLARHMGYATAEHLHALRTLGPSPIHRRSFQPVRDLLPAASAPGP